MSNDSERACCPALRRWFAAGMTCAVFAVILTMAWSGKPADTGKAKEKQAARDWNLFGGSPQRNMVNTQDRDVPTQWDVKNKTNILWVADLGSKAYGGPVIADGKIFIGTNNENPRDPKIKGDRGVLMCFSEKGGQFLYQTVYDKLAAGRVQDWPREGICSTAVVQGKRIYYVNNRADVVCASTDGKKTHWKLDMIKQLQVFPHNLATSSPLIAGDLLFLLTSNGVDEGHINIPRPQAPSFLAVDKKTGKVAWQNNDPSANLVGNPKEGKSKDVEIKRLVDEGRLLMHGQWSNPSYTVARGRAQVIFPGGDGWLYSFEPKTSKLLWKFDCNPKDARYVLGSKGTRSDFLASPAIYDNKVYIGTGQDPEHEEGVGHLWCVDITKTPKNKDRDVSPEIVVGRNPLKTKPNPDSAKVWEFGGEAPKNAGRNYIFGRTMSTCAIHDGLVYACDLSGYFVCLDAQTGKKHWDHDMEAQTWCSPYWVDGKVYMGNDNGVLTIFRHGKKKEILTPDGIDMDGKIRATPVVANGVLYVMTENKLYAIKKK
jgi:outer membrane protein assembly factor BamB